MRFEKQDYTRQQPRLQTCAKASSSSIINIEEEKVNSDKIEDDIKKYKLSGEEDRQTDNVDDVGGPWLSLEVLNDKCLNFLVLIITNEAMWL